MRLIGISASVIGGALFLACCSGDTTLIGDYKQADLGGSNQVIIGNGGSIYVDRVSAYPLENASILIETQGNSLHQNCTYGRIDTSKNTLFGLPTGTALQREAIRAIKNHGRSVNWRSCALPG
jgi:hypothetical protein